MEKGGIQKWQKAEGDELTEGDVLVQIETDKATMDFETPEEGFLARILQPDGTKDVPIGAVSILPFWPQYFWAAVENSCATSSPVSTGIGDHPLAGVPSGVGQLSLAIPLWVGALSTGDGFGHCWEETSSSA